MAMNDILSINEVRSENSGELVGFELVTHPGGQKLLVFADQLGMPGFRIGDAFVPGYGDALAIGDATTFNGASDTRAAKERERQSDKISAHIGRCTMSVYGTQAECKAARDALERLLDDES